MSTIRRVSYHVIAWAVLLFTLLCIFPNYKKTTSALGIELSIFGSLGVQLSDVLTPCWFLLPLQAVIAIALDVWIDRLLVRERRFQTLRFMFAVNFAVPACASVVFFAALGFDYFRILVLLQ